MPSTIWGGSLERLARVVRRMCLPSRWAWRKRMAGGGGAVAVGDDVDVVGHGARPFTWKQHRTQSYCVSSINKDYYALRTWQQISSLQSGLWSGKPRYSNDLVDGARA